MNIKDFNNKYQVNIAKEELKTAFSSPDNFSDWYSNLIETILLHQLSEDNRHG